MKTAARRVGLGLYLGFLVAPVYWLLNLSFQTNAEISDAVALFPRGGLSGENYAAIFGDAAWTAGYGNAALHAASSTLIALGLALPAAYALSRYRFAGNRPMLAWLLFNRLAAPAVFVLPFYEVFRALALIDTHAAVTMAHLLFNLPIAVWLLEGYISRVPREIDETACLEGYSFPRFFATILLPAIRPGVMVTAAFCFLFSWGELLLARSLAPADAAPFTVTMMRAATMAEPEWGVIAAAGVLAMAPGLLIVCLARNHIARVFSLGRL